MKENKSILHLFNKKVMCLIGILLILILAIVLLWYGNATSNQSLMPMIAKVYFDGEYRIADGEWQKIVKGEHISSTKGDVTLRGNFHMLAPDGEYVGIYSGDTPIAFYLNHIHLTFFEGGNEPVVMDIENPLYKESICGVCWIAYSFTSESEEKIEILVHNSHNFGNENAIDELLSNMAFWTGIDFEKEVLSRGETQRNIGLFVIIASLLFLGSALFSTLIHVKNSEVMWVFAIVILFAGTYIVYSIDGISFWSESIVANTIILGCSMILYMLFLSMAIVHFFKMTKKVGTISVFVLGAIDAILFIIPILTKIFFYDTWIYWAILQMIVNIILASCLIIESIRANGKERFLYLGLILPLVSFCVDIILIDIGYLNNGFASISVFIVLFIIAIVAVLNIIPNSINALKKAKELETEKILLNAQLTESRMSTMMSQIRPHFIYNTLGSIEQLCILDPPKAGELVHNFAKYLRGNFGELDNPKPILMSQEMEHVRHYVNIEKVRFPDMTFLLEVNSGDFSIPALTIQPLVENAIKHGLMKLQKGGTIHVMTYETDTHYCVLVEDDGVGFDTDVLLDDRKHIGIRNIRGRLKAMVTGELEIESTVGVGTKVLIKIPKEVQK